MTLFPALLATAIHCSGGAGDAGVVSVSGEGVVQAGVCRLVLLRPMLFASHTMPSFDEYLQLDGWPFVVAFFAIFAVPAWSVLRTPSGSPKRNLVAITVGSLCGSLVYAVFVVPLFVLAATTGWTGELFGNVIIGSCSCYVSHRIARAITSRDSTADR